MPLFGAHLSIAGGCHKALLGAQNYNFDTVQLFTKNNNQWNAKPLTPDDIKLFRDTLNASSLKFPTAHACYLINLASPDPALFQRSLDALVIEMQRAEALGLSYLVLHPGSPTDGDEEAGLNRVVQGIDEMHARCKGFRVKLLLETTAGQGHCLGHRFEHLGAILARVQDSNRLGVCFDTCHVFVAGYLLAPHDDYDKTLNDFDRLIGLDRLEVFHLNDSAKPFGSRVDRHDHIGKGHLGLEPFRLIVNDSRFEGRPMIMETPKEGPNDEDMDPVNLQTLRDLVGKTS